MGREVQKVSEFWICLAGMACGITAGYIKAAVDKRHAEREAERLYKRIEALANNRDTWRKVADDRLPGRRPAA